MNDVQIVTQRQMEVIEHLSSGKTNKQIALLMLISENTVKVHLSALFGKFGANNRTELLYKFNQWKANKMKVLTSIESFETAAAAKAACEKEGHVFQSAQVTEDNKYQYVYNTGPDNSATATGSDTDGSTDATTAGDDSKPADKAPETSKADTDKTNEKK